MSEVIEMLLRAHDYVYMALNDESQDWSTEDKYNLCAAQELIAKVLPDAK